MNQNIVSVLAKAAKPGSIYSQTKQTLTTSLYYDSDNNEETTNDQAFCYQILEENLYAYDNWITDIVESLPLTELKTDKDIKDIVRNFLYDTAEYREILARMTAVGNLNNRK